MIWVCVCGSMPALFCVQEQTIILAAYIPLLSQWLENQKKFSVCDDSKRKNKKTFLSGRLLEKYLNWKLKLLWSSLCMPLNLASNTCYLFRNSELCQRWLQSFAVIVCRCLWLYEQKLAMYPSPVWLEAFCLTLHSCRSIVCQCMVCILLISVHVLYVYAHIGKNTYNIQSLHFWSIYFLP